MNLLVRMLILALVVAGGYYGYQYWQQGQPPTVDELTDVGDTLEELTGSVAGYSIDLESLRQSGTDQLKTLTERAGELGGHTRTLISTATPPQSDEESSGQSKPLHQTAAEYGQYVYCKQVVESYESLQKVQDSAGDEN